MELTDIMPVEGWKKIAEDIYKKFGFNGTVYEKNNNILVKSEELANKICPAIKAGDSVVICSSAQQRLSKVVEENKEFIVDECDASFTKFLIPIFINNEFVGMVGGCGCLAGDSEVDTFYVSKLLNKEDINDILTSVKRISQDKLIEAIRYVQKQIQESLKN